MKKLDINKLITVDVAGYPKAPSIEQLLDKDILQLYTRDKTHNKTRYIAEVGVIYYLGNPNSSVRQKGLSDNECLKEAINNFDLDPNYVPDQLVTRLIARYRNECITEAGVALEALNKSIHMIAIVANRINDMLEKKLNNTITDEDIPSLLTLIDSVNKRIVEIPAMTKALATAQENLANEEEAIIARGGQKVTSSMNANDYED